MGWAGFAAVFAVFFLTHSIPVRPPVKARLVDRIGERGFGAGYSILSVGMLAILIWAAGEAPHVQLWPQLSWHRHAAHLGMLAVCVILALSIARPNPFSFGGARNDRFDPARSGIVGWTRHPVLLALAIWAGVHLLPNGDLSFVILFGVLGSFAIVGRVMIDRRKRAVMGASNWEALDTARKTGARFHAPRSWSFLILRLMLGIAVFAALLLAHPYVIGVQAV